MIEELVDRLFEQEAAIREDLRNNPPRSYDDLVKRLVGYLADVDTVSGQLDPKRIHVIDDGEYQGTRLFIVGAQGYQPRTYWSIFVNYGSCSVCDTFQAARELDDEFARIDDYWSLMLHMVQQLAQV